MGLATVARICNMGTSVPSQYTQMSWLYLRLLHGTLLVTIIDITLDVKWESHPIPLESCRSGPPQNRDCL